LTRPPCPTPSFFKPCWFRDGWFQAGPGDGDDGQSGAAQKLTITFPKLQNVFARGGGRILYRKLRLLWNLKLILL
jgi:hypothetical protein